MEQLVHIPGGPGAAGTAREAFSGFEGAPLPQQVVDDVRLLISELVTNSVRHGGAIGSKGIRLKISFVEDSVRVEVTDKGVGFDVPGTPTPRTDLTGGWGLVLLDRIAHRWGVDRAKRGTMVWFEIDVDEAGARPKLTAVSA
jgi:anti-sigma regulatory factor (Ser/Thr protein kinase)